MLLLDRAHVQKNGPAFVAALNEINNLLRMFKYPPQRKDPSQLALPNSIKQSVSAWTPKGMPFPVARRIVEETYQRVVGPRIAELKKYESFSNEVYGELNPNFVDEHIIKLAGLGPGKLLLDLGSGVGNVPIQAALQTGCRAFGIEIMGAPADIANEQLEQAKIRARMWGVAMGEVELMRGDMLEERRVSELMAEADVVLVNNKVFSQERTSLPRVLSPCMRLLLIVGFFWWFLVNEAIRPKFLDLKEGALVISLQPFVAPEPLKMTERNLDDMAFILKRFDHQYSEHSVSWSAKEGDFYVHRMDRARYAQKMQDFQAEMLASGGRATRSRR